MEEMVRIWGELEAEASASETPPSRLLRALGAKAVGIRAGYVPETRMRELLIEVPPDWAGLSSLPSWSGMLFEALDLSLPPRPDAHQLRLTLKDASDEHIFLKVCADLLEALEGLDSPARRVAELEECIACWDRFFKGKSPEGLTDVLQRALYGELKWLERLLNANGDPLACVKAWKGWERNYHDFDMSGKIVEVKSTLSKEPRKVRISNERQLDDRGLGALHLYVATLHKTDGGGETLPELVEAIRSSLVGSAKTSFNRRLTGGGYLDLHAERYDANYLLKQEELFTVGSGFPRIIDLPDGAGDLKYSVTPAACHPWETDIGTYLDGLHEAGGSDEE